MMVRTARLIGLRWSCFEISRTLVAVCMRRECDMPSSSAEISSNTRSTLTASSKRWWKKHGDCAKRVANEALGLLPKPDMEAERLWEEVLSWWVDSLDVRDARAVSMVWFGVAPLDRVPFRWFKKDLEVRRAYEEAVPVGGTRSSGESLT